MGRKTKVALTVGAAGVAAWAATKAVMKPEPRKEKKALQFSEPAVLAHRGNTADASEHTLKAFTEAADLGVHGFMVDVRLTKDEEIIVYHDEDLDQLVGLAGKVSDYTLEDLTKTNPEQTDEEADAMILSLSDLLATFPQLLIVVSMQDSPDTYEGSLMPSKLWRLIEELDAQDRIVVSSPYDEQIDRFNLYAQNAVALGGGQDEVKKAYAAYSSKFGHLYKPHADLVCLPVKLGVFPLASEGFIQFLSHLNIAVFFETEDDADVPRLHQMGASGFVTSDPARVIESFQ